MLKKCIAGGLMVAAAVSASAQKIQATAVTTTINNLNNKYYTGNRAPLLKNYFTRLPVTAFRPGGWLLRQLELQREGLTGHLGEISIWLSKSDNAWLNKEGKGKWGWEELPYWLKGYGDIAYVLNDKKMIAETKFWIDKVLENQRPDGDFGPDVVKNGSRDLWTNMPMLWCLQSYYSYSGDQRVIDFMTKYFRFEAALPDDKFLEDYWEKSRGGDNLLSVYWLYNITGDTFLLDLATKIDRNTADWRQENNLPNWHNVNIAQCFREPATYYLQSAKESDRQASYRNFALVKEKFGQVPGGMWGGDENSRTGYSDPRQAIETCGMVEQMTSDQYMLQFTGDTRWADHCEDVAFNSFPAAFMPDYKSLRYLTAPNMVQSDQANHAPGIDNNGPFLMMNPFSSRCCQHNHAAGWVYYAESAWMATPDNGLAVQLYTEGNLKAKAGGGTPIEIITKTHYPFDNTIQFQVICGEQVDFPLYLRIPDWCAHPVVKVNGRTLSVTGDDKGYLKLKGSWKNGDKVTLQLPMAVRLQEWKANKNSVSVNYGPLSFSLKIDENYKQRDSKETAIGDSRWQESADATKWPSWEIFPGNAWNYGLYLDKYDALRSVSVVKKEWPKDNNPFRNDAAPIVMTVKGKLIPGWKIDQYGLCDTLPQSPVVSKEPVTELTLVPMGGARLRIAAFPVAE
ncbi:beta-L-arabinofuranosidase domain-containing protein [Flavihumibacter petaseus]|uniref:DUF1680 family protein n=1 Tax=Flavihumibacter petaseus NBRC 106054 TaxID=1220578 RepID=A0A0E9MWQ8_9BACT|nr:beta-L-arabinofuranosidase domain-containing protein [Flavihumibacter petaseus]GAO41550.1 hypothetical protein FPE01S_01_05640 [Flavihumibacter petaseus NBRC 106054]